jgi:hypothetical protein
MEEVKLDLTRVSLLFNRPALNVVVKVKELAKHVLNVEVMVKFKVMKMFL